LNGRSADLTGDFVNFTCLARHRYYYNLFIMYKINEYFDGKVKSISFETPEGPATIGVMAGGEYTFGTSLEEHMTVTSGNMDVMLPGGESWKRYNEFETFIVPAGVSFRVRVAGDTAYRCYYR
jgi:purine/pyrimidine-nucleoside phosphorylase